MLEFRIDGEPRPKQSFRVAIKEGKVSGYTPKQVQEWQRIVRSRAVLEMAGREPLQGDIVVWLFFELSNRRRCDLDNLSKAILDALNGVIWDDDMNIVDLHIQKIVSDTPGVTVNVRLEG